MQKSRSFRSTVILTLLLTSSHAPSNTKESVAITPDTPFPVLSSYFDKSINEAGLLDYTFGAQGIVIGPGGGSRGLAVGLQSDGTIITAGFSGVSFLITAYNPDGSPVTRFGTNGSTIGPDQIAYALVIQPDQKIVAAGFGPGGNGFCIARYNADGSPDTTFNGTGFIVDPVAGGIFGVALQSDGKIVAAGNAGGNFCTARYTTNGILDLSFNGTGVATGPAGGASFVAIQSDGKIVVVGKDGGNNACVLRYNQDGSPDTSFGNIGVATGPASDVFAGVLQPDGKIVSVGNDRLTKFRFVRFNSNGSLDTTFGIGGISDPGIGDPRGATIQPDGKIIAVGYNPVAGKNFVVIRINPDGSADTTFGVNGIATTVLAAGSYGSGVALQPNGAIVVSGVDGAGHVGLARYMNPFTVPSFTQIYGGTGLL